jgi:hypothetical protein
MLKKLSVGSLLFFTAAIWLFAANFWDTKPFTEWSDKELEKLLQDSPWGDRMSVRTGERGVVAQDDAKGPIMGETEVSVTLLWQSALPIRQALAKAQAKGGPITPEAQAVIERQTDVHVLRIQGLPASARAAATAKEQLTADTGIKIKNKPDLKPSISRSAARHPPQRLGRHQREHPAEGKALAADLAPLSTCILCSRRRPALPRRTTKLSSSPSSAS